MRSDQGNEERGSGSGYREGNRDEETGAVRLYHSGGRQGISDGSGRCAN